ncbi:uracil-DNA glycosylase [Rhabdochlamydiaceae symbiont of Dictyostelium giganteum]|uniref:uracil-DNA glycosylase n=1 Tax=Rhabdochlamydiaceae symbiont of Dictyostelium giganteum TaxID=3342349 RepID=UPI003850E3B6
MQMKLEKSWFTQLQHEIEKPYIQQLKAFLQEEFNQGKTIYPPQELIFNAFLQTPFSEVKVVIIGQDPYHGRGQAHGLSFSVLPDVKIPPSLKNIYKEMESDLGIVPPTNGCLDYLAKQGVLLLNATLTVREGEPKSHYGKGWEQFTDAVVDVLVQRKDPLVFILWGASAKEKGQRAKGLHHAVFESAHPSPYSATQFLGCKHFSKTNTFLESVGKTPIRWS